MIHAKLAIGLARAGTVAAVALATTGLVSASTFTVGALSTVSGLSPFSANCNGAPQSGTVFVNSEVEPFVAIDPNDSSHVVGVWQQDRWSNGGSNGLLTGVTFNGGQSWKRTAAAFSRCAGGNPQNGGDYERATDPWVTFAPNGDLYQISDSINDSNTTSAILVSKSSDGGRTWSTPTTLLRDTAPTVLNDKESITADPHNSNLVYAIWDRLVFPQVHASAAASEHALGYRGPTWFSRTTDAGASWEPARIVYDPGEVNQTIGNEIVVTPSGMLVDGFDLILNFNNSGKNRGLNVAYITSSDQGATWSGARIVDKLLSVGITDPDNGRAVRTGDIIPSWAAGPDGNLYAVWQDSRFSGGAHDDIAFSMSSDGGVTWSSPLKLNQSPSGVQAFTAAISVSADGTVGVTYYDFRNNTPAPGLTTDYWVVHCHGGCTSAGNWSETHVDGPFNLEAAPFARGYFTGDYQGLASFGLAAFRPFWVHTNTNTTSIPTNATDVVTTVAR